MVKCAYNETYSAFYFSLHAEVGQGCANRLDDVEFVRFGIFCLTTWPETRADPAARPFLDAAAKVRPEGGFDPSITAALLAFQRFRGLTTDGKVSLVRGDFTPKGRTYLLQFFSGAMRQFAPSAYPRIDLAAQAGPVLSQAVRTMFIGAL